MSSSISFDRAVGYYDKTRGLPADQAQQLADMIVAELAGRDRTLEIGVGTGRIALPLHERGVDLVGIDISLPMLAQLVANASGQQPFPLLVADATRLPFVDGGYDAAIASHVFHLIPTWRAAADEVLRVLAPGGVLLADFGRHGGGGPYKDAVVEAFRRHGIKRTRAGVTEPDEFAAHVGDRVVVRRLPTVVVPMRMSLGQELDGLEQQIMSWTWSIPSEQMRAACEDVRAWARAEGVDVDEHYDLPYELQWWAYELPI